MAYEHLERLAAENINDAIKLDRRGSKSLASVKYQRAVEILMKLSDLYPTSPQNRVYLERAQTYQSRLYELQRGNGTLE